MFQSVRGLEIASVLGFSAKNVACSTQIGMYEPARMAPYVADSRVSFHFFKYILDPSYLYFW